jgi:isocitrate/isopropylmalate dehydrogenase
MLLIWAGESGKADKVQHAVDHVLKNGIVTADLGGSASTQDVSRAIVEYIDQNLP